MKGRALAVVLTLLLAAALVGQGIRGWARVRSTMILGAVRGQMMAIQQVGRAPTPLLRLAEAAVVEAIRLDPVAIEPRAFHGDLLLLARRPADAAVAYERAAAHEVRAEILVHHGIALWQLGRHDEALIQMRRGVSVAPPLLRSVPPAAYHPLHAAPVQSLPER